MEVPRVHARLLGWNMGTCSSERWQARAWPAAPPRGEALVPLRGKARQRLSGSLSIHMLAQMLQSFFHLIHQHQAQVAWLQAG